MNPRKTKSKQVVTPKPLFDTLSYLNDISPHVQDYLARLPVHNSLREYQLCLEFLKSYKHSDDTFNAYRREVERFLHWSWLICQKPVREITRNDLRDFFEFIQQPPKQWIGDKIVERFLLQDGIRQPHPDWRPFVIKQAKKISTQQMVQAGINKPVKSHYALSNKSIEAIFAVLGSLFNFLQQEEYLEVNPIALLRQKKSLVQRQQQRKVTRKLSKLQWHTVISTAEEMAKENVIHERTLFLMSTFYLLGLRISELSYSEKRQATMGNFAPDKRGLWWYTTVGKGNKIRDVAVPDVLLHALKRYRVSLGLPALPHRNDETPLFAKLKGKLGLGARQIRNIVQSVFNLAIDKLHAAGKIDEALDLATATVHWLRHTAISSEVEYRPREHIRDDVGHENPATMDKYIDTDRLARHRSAQDKQLKPELDD